MAMSQPPLPEGTDSILSGASSAEIDRSGDQAGAVPFGAAGSGGSTGGFGNNSGSSGSTSAAAEKLGDVAAKVSDATSSLRAQATDKARDYAVQGKERAVDGLDSVVKLVDDAAGKIDEKVGAQYGEYARSASKIVAGLADTLREKDVDELFADARDAVRKSPAIAIGAAAALGFVIARLVKSSQSEDISTAGATASTYGSTRPVATPLATTPSTATTVPVDSSY